MNDSKQLLAQAKQGDAIALASLLNQSLRSQNIWVRVDMQGQNWHIILESTEAPEANTLIPRLETGLRRLQPQNIQLVQFSGRALGDTVPAWEHHLTLRRDRPSDFAITNSSPGAAKDTSSRSTLTPVVAPPLAPRQLEAQPRARSPLPHRTRRPLVLKWSDFHPLMLITIGFVAVLGFLGSLDPSYDGPLAFLHFPNLAIHETGHLLFMPFGYFLMVLGGSLTQIAFPAAFTIYFFYSQQRFSSALTLFWTGQNFMDVAVYMADAPYRQLPLTVNDIDAHDWWQLFTLMNCLNQAELIAGITHSIGVVIYIVAVIGGAYFAYQYQQDIQATLHRRMGRN